VTARVYAVIFAGACLGGAARLGIDLAIDNGSWSWDIVAINLLGSAFLGALTGWFAVYDAPWWIPGIGTGALGGFTTFSSMAAPHPDAPLPGAILLIGTLVGASIAAAVGWRVSESIALRHGPYRLPLDVEGAEAEVEGFESESFENNGLDNDGLDNDEVTPWRR